MKAAAIAQASSLTEMFLLKAILAAHTKNIFMGNDCEAMGQQSGHMLLF